MKKILIVAMTMAVTGWGQLNFNGPGAGVWDMSSMKVKPQLATVSTLPTASTNTGYLYLVSDGNPDCGIGGGSTPVWCRSNGTSWVTIGGSGGGGGGSVFTGSTGAIVPSSASPSFNLADVSVKSPIRFNISPIVDVTSPTIINKTAGARFEIAITTDGTHAWSWNSIVADNACNVYTAGAATTIAKLIIDPDGSTVHGDGCDGGPTGAFYLGPLGSALAAPGASNLNCWMDSTDVLLECIQSSGVVKKFLATDNSGIAGAVDLTQGTLPATQAANTFRLYAPVAIGTAYAWKVPAADAAGGITSDGSGNLSLVPYIKLSAANTAGASFTLDASGATGGNAFKVPSVASVTTAVNGAIGYNTTTDMLHAAQASADAMIPQFTVIPANGDCANWVVSGSKYKLGTAGAGCGTGSGGGAGANLFSTTGSTTVTAASATTLIGTATGSTTIPANTFTTGSLMEVVAQGYYTASGSRTLTINLNIGGSTRITTGAVTAPGATNGTWAMQCGVTTRTTGSSGTQIANCMTVLTGATLTASAAAPMQTASAWTVDTTGTLAVDLQAAWDATTGAPTITSTNVVAWIPGAPVTSVFGLTGAVPNLSGDLTTSGSSATTLATKYKTVKLAGYEVGSENASAAFVTADLTAHSFDINGLNPKTLTEASCISDAGSQSVTVKIGGTTLFSITCVAFGSYSTGTTNGTTGYIVAASMGSTAVAAHDQLDLSGTANGTTKDVKLFIYGTVN